MTNVRKIFSFVLLVAAILVLVSFFLAAGTIIFDPFKAAFDPFNFKLLGAALYGFMSAIGVPLIMFMLGLIGLTMGNKD